MYVSVIIGEQNQFRIFRMRCACIAAITAHHDVVMWWDNVLFLIHVRVELTGTMQHGIYIHIVVEVMCIFKYRYVDLACEEHPWKH